MSIIKKGAKDIVKNVDDAMTNIFGFEANDRNRAVWQSGVTIRSNPIISASTNKVTDSEVSVTILTGTTQDFSLRSQGATE